MDRLGVVLCLIVSEFFMVSEIRLHSCFEFCSLKLCWHLCLTLCKRFIMKALTYRPHDSLFHFNDTNSHHRTAFDKPVKLTCLTCWVSDIILSVFNNYFVLTLWGMKNLFWPVQLPDSGKKHEVSYILRRLIQENFTTRREKQHTQFVDMVEIVHD